MDRSSLNALTVKQAAELLALRREAARTVNGLVKQSDIGEQLGQYKDQVGQWLGDLWNANPNYEQAAQSGQLGQFWDETTRESIRNALLGGAAGGGLGALKSVVSGDDELLNNMLTGGMLGAAAGGGGTAAYRGLQSVYGPSPTELQDQAKQQEAETQYQDTLGKATQPDSNMGERTLGATAAAMKGRLGDLGEIAQKAYKPGVISRTVSELGETLGSGQGLSGFDLNAVQGGPQDKMFGTTDLAIGGGLAGLGLGKLHNRAAMARRLKGATPEQLNAAGFYPEQQAGIRAARDPNFFRRPSPGRAMSEMTYRGLSGNYQPFNFRQKYRRFMGRGRRAMPYGLGLLGALAGAYEGSKGVNEPSGTQQMMQWLQ